MMTAVPPREELDLVFMGTPAFAATILEALIEAGHDIRAVYTQPPRPAGRGHRPQASPVQLLAMQNRIAVFCPVNLRPHEAQATFAALGADAAVVAAYGLILPRAILAAPRLGCLNVHASLLPKYRGAAPIQWSVIHGERETGVTLMQMDAGMDTGAMLLQRALPVDDRVTAGELHVTLSRLGAEVLRDGLAALKAGTLVPRPQDPALATMAPMLTKETGRVDFAAGARAVRDLVRGCDPWPTAYTTLDGAPLKLFRAKIVSGQGVPGRVLGADRDGLIVGCGGDAVAFAELQLPGKKRLSAQALLAGRPIPTGTQLGI